jgi:hypothetical protein
MMARSMSHPVYHIGLGQPPKATKSQGGAESRLMELFLSRMAFSFHDTIASEDPPLPQRNI